MNLTKAVFLDRDGVLNKDVGYPHDLEDSELLWDVVPALRKLQKAGFVFYVVSNQSGVGLGFFGTPEVLRFNGAITEQLQQAGVDISIEDFYFCPHAPDAGCDCRKPLPGLLLRAAREHGIDLAESFCIGDKETDIEAGRRAGTKTILLNREDVPQSTRADAVVSSLLDAAAVIVSDLAS